MMDAGALKRFTYKLFLPVGHKIADMNFKGKTPNLLWKCYAGTEAGLISSHSQGEIKFESVGRPALGTSLRITDRGELLVKSGSMFKGYHKAPDKTAAALIDGWCHTGDAVNIDDEGNLIFTDRLGH